MIRKLHLVGLIVATLAAPAFAQPARPNGEAADHGDVDDGDRRYAVTAGWAAILAAIPAWYYWSTQEEQEVDWTRPSWKEKLTFRSARFDTNAFHVNALRHPFVGVGDYQIARSNGFTPLEATAFAYLTGVLWEFFVEYNEDPSINDMIINGAGGLAIGEPFYQVGQLWRGGQLSIADRVRSAAFSPFAATQDLWRTHRGWHRRRAWSDFAFTIGARSHRLDTGAFRDELAVGADIDVVRHPGFVSPGAHDGRIATGAWSRIALAARFGSERGADPMATELRTRTSLAGAYAQDDTGDGRLLALGTGFTYRRDRLGAGSDHVAIAHLLGPQLQLSRRTRAGELRWDVAAYADFGMIDAHVFGPVSPLPPSPPYLSTLQVEGYYNAAGTTLETRLRGDTGPWHAELEVAAHRLWSLDFADRVQQAGDLETPGEPGAGAALATAAAQYGGKDLPATPHGVSDLRVYGHGQIGARGDRLGIAATADLALRRGTWSDLSRETAEWAVGLAATVNL